MSVELISITPDAEKTMAYCARVSNPTNQNNENYAKLLKYCIDHKHWSIFEHAHLTIEINTTRGLAAQILRHRSFTFQEFCMSGDTNVYFDLPNAVAKSKRQKYSLTLKHLYNSWIKNKHSRHRIKNMCVRVYDEISRTLTHAHIKEVFQTGLKDIFEITLDNGKIIRCTKEHKVLTKKGFQSLEDCIGLKIIGNTAVMKYNSYIGCNGIPVYRDYEWLKTHKQQSIINGTGLGGIAEDAGTSIHTVRKWLKKHGLGFTKKEVPVSKDVSLAREYSNIMPVHASCHMKHHKLYDDHKTWREKSSGNTMTVSWSKVKSVKHLGRQMTYDLEIDHSSHNYVADGVIVHNSQRYADTSSLAENIPLFELRGQDNKNRQNSIDNIDETTKQLWSAHIADHFKRAKEIYNGMIADGIAKECARFVLPLATPTRLYVTGNVRSWIHYIALREKNGTQKEHMMIAKDCKKIFCDNLPTVAESLGGYDSDWQI